MRVHGVRFQALLTACRTRQVWVFFVANRLFSICCRHFGGHLQGPGLSFLAKSAASVCSGCFEQIVCTTNRRENVDERSAKFQKKGLGNHRLTQDLSCWFTQIARMQESISLELA